MPRPSSAALCLVAAAAACVSLSCVERRITVTSDPPGALAYLNNQEIGRTPVTRDFIWYGDYDVQLRKEGYQTLKAHEQVIAPWWQWVPFDFFAELYPGRLHDERTIAFAMPPSSTQPVDADAMLDRAADLHRQLRSSEFTRAPSTQPTTMESAKSAKGKPTTRDARTP